MSAYWTAERLRIWRNLTPAERDYDRYQGAYPPGEAWCETEAGQFAVDQRAGRAFFDAFPDHGCHCHINPPCSHCTDCVECFGDEQDGDEK